jgi:serine/threonine-protein kinase
LYLAHGVKHARDVAVKVIRQDLSASLGHDRFLREIEIAAGLRHPNIVPLYDSGLTEYMASNFR